MSQKPEHQDAAPAPVDGEIVAEKDQASAKSARKAKAAVAIDLPASAVSDVTPAETPVEAKADEAAPERTEAAPADSPKAEELPVPPPVAKPATPKLVPGLIGLVAGVIGGLGASQFAGFLPFKAPAKPDAALEQRLAGFEAALKAAPAASQPLLDRLAKAEAALADGTKREEALRGEIAKLNAAIAKESADRTKAIAERPVGLLGTGTGAPDSTVEIERLKGRLGTIETSAKAVPEAIGALAAKGEAVIGKVDALAPRLDQMNMRVETLAPKLNAVTDQVSALQKTVAGVASRDGLAQAASRVAATSLLAEAFFKGEGLAASLNVLKNLGEAAPNLALLAPYAEKGAPNAATLLAELKAIKPKPADGAKPANDVLERVKTGVLSLVEVRKTGAITGTDDDAHLARAEQALIKGDIATAITLVGRISAPRNEAYAAWKARAEARAKAEDLVGKLKSDAVAALAASAAKP